MLEGLGVVAGGAAAHVALDHAGGHGLRQLGLLDGDRLRAHQLGDAAGGGAVGAPLDALQVGRAVDLHLGEDALWRPSHRIQQHHALLGQLLLDGGLAGLVELEGLGVAGGQERNAVDAPQRPLVLEVDQQNVAGLRLPALHGALDLGRLEQRGVVVDLQLQLAARRRVHVLGELRQVLGVHVAGRVGGGHVPLGLCAGGQGQAAQAECHQRGQGASFHHRAELLEVGRRGGMHRPTATAPRRSGAAWRSCGQRRLTWRRGRRR